MQTYSYLSIPGKFATCFAMLILVLISVQSAAQDNTFSGTYTFVIGSPHEYNVLLNMSGQHVGFCDNLTTAAQFPYGYYCQTVLGQDVFTGTLIANGTGSITTASTYVLTYDINRQKCSSKFNAAPDCPYKVPAGITWNSSVKYVVGDEVDFTVSGKVLTFQAVQNNTNVPPNTSTCTSATPPPNCDWDQLFVSATGKVNASGALSGTYTVQSNGSAVASMTAVTPKGNIAIGLSMVVPTTPLAVGQVVPMMALPALGNEFRGSGAAVRIE